MRNRSDASLALLFAAIATAQSANAAPTCTVIDIGLATTPTCQLAVEHHHAAGGLMISASHNPIEWNALKFINSAGLFLADAQARQLLDIYHQGEYRKVSGAEMRAISKAASPLSASRVV